MLLGIVAMRQKNSLVRCVHLVFFFLRLLFFFVFFYALQLVNKNRSCVSSMVYSNILYVIIL